MQRRGNNHLLWTSNLPLVIKGALFNTLKSDVSANNHLRDDIVEQCVTELKMEPLSLCVFGYFQVSPSFVDTTRSPGKTFGACLCM